MENRIKDGNFYVVQSFMVKELKLKGLELNVYAIIYGFTQGEGQRFTGSLQYLADWCCSSKQGILKCLKSLVEKGFIAREERIINNITFVEYYSTEFNTPSKLSLIPPIKQSLPNNIDINNKDNKESKKEPTFDDIISNEITNQELRNTLYEFIKMRKLIKKPMTNLALQRLINKLHKLAKTPDIAIKILEQSIINDYQDIYTLKEKEGDNCKDGRKKLGDGSKYAGL